MKRLKKDGKCGIVVPEGILFNTSEKAFVSTKKDLLENYNLHTIISLPSGVFANVTSSGQGPKTNLLFFDKTIPTKEVWYYDFAGYSETVLGKKYTKANPVLDEDLNDVFERCVNPAPRVLTRGFLWYRYFDAPLHPRSARPASPRPCSR